MRLLKSFLISPFIFLCLSLHGQDQHFSFFMYSPSRVNAALIATSNDFNANAINRSQWKSIVNPFLTYNVNASCPLLYRNNYRWGAVGLSIMNNVSGDNGMLHISQISGSFAYNIQAGSSNHFAFAIQPSYITKRIDVDKITTGSQYINGSYVSTASINDDLLRPNVGFLEISGSMLWYSPGKDGNLRYFSGITVSNINRPNEDFILRDYRLPLRYTYIGGLNVFENSNVVISPKLLLMIQAKAYNAVAGSNFYYKFRSNSSSNFVKDGTVGIGTFYRFGDALILSAEYTQPHYKLGISHDFNFFSISKNLNLTGATELFLSYKIPVKRKWRPAKGKKNHELKSNKPGKATVQKEKRKEEAPKHTIILLTTVNKETRDTLLPSLDFVKKDLDKLSYFTIDTSYRNKRAILGLPKLAILKMEVSETGYFTKNVKIITKGEDTLRIDIELHPIKKGDVLLLENILFESMSATLDSTSFDELDKLSMFMKNNPNVVIEISGHSDDQGSAKFNEKLSLERAKAIASYLEQQNISSARMVIKGYGESRPLYRGKDENSRAMNRRVEIKILEE